MIACGIFSAVGLDQLLKDRARSIVPFNWLPWCVHLRKYSPTSCDSCIFRLPQLMTELQERPLSGFIHVVEKIASVYPLLVISALRPLLDAATIDEVIESGITSVFGSFFVLPGLISKISSSFERTARSDLP